VRIPRAVTSSGHRDSESISQRANIDLSQIDIDTRFELLSNQINPIETHHEAKMIIDRYHSLAADDLFRQSNLIGPDWIADFDNGHIEVTDPATGARIGRIPKIRPVDTERCLNVARDAFHRWSRKPARIRANALRRWHDLILARKDDLALILSLEQGKPTVEALAEIEYAASFVRWFSEEAERVYGRIAPSLDGSSRLVVNKVPVGVVAAITPWNAPCSMVTRKVAPAIAAGCSVVLKPAEATPFSALALAKLALDAGIDAGVFNVITGDPAQIGDAFTQSPRVQKISFTGSTPIGRHLLAKSATTMKRVSLETGGNAPFIVMHDADLELAIDCAMVAKFRAGGQSCVAANRFFIHSSIYDAFLTRLVGRVEALTVGHGLSGTDIGPVINESAALRINELIDDAVRAGAVLMCGGHETGTAFVHPAVVCDVNPSMRIYNEEVFGPVASVCSFTDLASLVTALNSEDTGLIAYLIGKQTSQMTAIADDLDVGMVGLNTGLVSDASMPFGGMKCSGLGREGSKEGIEAFLETKYIKSAG